MKKGDKYYCIKDNYYNKYKPIHKKGNYYVIRSILSSSNIIHKNDIIYMENENNTFHGYCLNKGFNDFEVFGDYFIESLKAYRKLKLEKINERISTE